MNMNRVQLEWMADTFGPMVGWPTQLNQIADELQRANPNFNRDKWLRRATDAWEANYNPSEINDEIPYQENQNEGRNKSNLTGDGTAIAI